jgi:hypothetical protein
MKLAALTMILAMLICEAGARPKLYEAIVSATPCAFLQKELEREIAQ